MPNTHRRRRRDETVLSCWRRRCEHEFATSWRQFRRVVSVNTHRRQSWPSLQFPVLTTDKWRHNYNDVIVEKIVKIHEYYTTQQIRMFTDMQHHNVTSLSYFYSIGCRIVNLVTAIGCVHIAESVGSRRELVANSCTHRRRGGQGGRGVSVKADVRIYTCTL